MNSRKAVLNEDGGRSAYPKSSAPDVSYEVGGGAFDSSVKASPSAISRKTKPRFKVKQAAPETEVYVPGIADAANGQDATMAKRTPRFVTKQANPTNDEPAPGMFDSPALSKPGMMDRSGTPGGANRSTWLTPKDQVAAPVSGVAPSGAFDSALSVPRASPQMSKASPRFKVKQAAPETSATPKSAFTVTQKPSAMSMTATPRFGKKYAATQMNGEPGIDR